MGLLLIKEKRFLFGEFALRKPQYLYNNVLFIIWRPNVLMILVVPLG